MHETVQVEKHWVRNKQKIMRLKKLQEREEANCVKRIPPGAESSETAQSQLSGGFLVNIYHWIICFPNRSVAVWIKLDYWMSQRRQQSCQPSAPPYKAQWPMRPKCPTVSNCKWHRVFRSLIRFRPLSCIQTCIVCKHNTYRVSLNCDSVCDIRRNQCTCIFQQNVYVCFLTQTERD